MTPSASDRLSLTLEFSGRTVFACIALAYFLGVSAANWTLDVPFAIAGLVVYLLVQGALLARTVLGREAPWVAPLAMLVDAIAVLCAVASDPAALPPTLLLVLVAALNVGLRGNWPAFVAAVAGSDTVIIAALVLREQWLGEIAGHDLLYAIALLIACILAFTLLALRRRILLAHAARFADQDMETQMLNRRGFDNASRYLVPLHQRTQLPLVIVLASLDNKSAQPLDARTLAQVVRQFGHVVRQRARRSDVVARLSADEFVFMLFDTPLAGGETLTRAMLERFNTWASQQGVDARITFGMVNTPDEPVAIDQLIARARSAVQRAQKHPSAPSVVTAPSL